MNKMISTNKNTHTHTRIKNLIKLGKLTVVFVIDSRRYVYNSMYRRFVCWLNIWHCRALQPFHTKKQNETLWLLLHYRFDKEAKVFGIFQQSYKIEFDAFRLALKHW